MRKSAGPEKVIEYLAPSDSDKMTDMQKLGIRHEDIQSQDPAVVSKYVKKVVGFHARYGWLYDFEGRFWGPSDKRPVLDESEEHI